MKIYILIIFSFFYFLSSNAQTSPKDLRITIPKVIASESLVLTVLTGKDKLTNSSVKIYNTDSKEIKSESLLLTRDGKEITINIKTLSYGKYTCVIVKDNKELFKESFTKDAVDPL
jgi:hypothetical protein